jgi:hypothetical protein
MPLSTNLLLLLLSTCSVALAGLLLSVSDSLQANTGNLRELSVEFQLNKPTGQTSTAVWNKDHTELLGHSCSSHLKIFQDDHVEFNVDEHGAGNVTVGSLSYTVHDDAKSSGGIICNRMHSTTEALVTCIVYIPQNAQVAYLNKRGLSTCFPNGAHQLGQVVEGLKSGPIWGTAEDAPMTTGYNASELHPGTLSKRQGSCGVWSGVTYRVGDGDPHQNPMNVQLSVSSTLKVGCPTHQSFSVLTGSHFAIVAAALWTGTCWVGHGESKSFSVSWSASANVFQWISAGFAVEQTAETGNDYNCEGQANEVVCVWKNQAQTAYTVQNGDYNRCSGTTDRGGRYVMWSPNAGGRGSYYYCVHGEQYCRNQGDRWLDMGGRAGGP